MCGSHVCLCTHRTDDLESDLVGDHRGVAVRDVGERTRVHENRGLLYGLQAWKISIVKFGQLKV